MIVFLNGNFIPEEQAVVSVFDRGFLYGDGLFEVARICKGEPFRWDAHMKRFERGVNFLKIKTPLDASELLRSARELIRRNAFSEGLLRITLSRGTGLRGYSPKSAANPTLLMTLHPAPVVDASAPPLWRVVTASPRLPANEPLAQFKSCNKLPQILARSEADAAGAEEALLLNTRGEIVEGSTSNLFWVSDGAICTPPLASGILPGVTRLVVLEICEKLGLPSREASITPGELGKTDGVFLSMSSWGVVEIVSLDGLPVNRSPIAAKIRTAYQNLLDTFSIRR